MADRDGEGPVRPWGRYEVLADDDDHKIKRIYVLGGRRLSLQQHELRDEHWILVAGRGRATVDAHTVDLAPGDAVDIPRRAVHRMENVGEEELMFVEVQTGEYFGEDDIQRIEDDYGRA